MVVFIDDVKRDFFFFFFSPQKKFRSIVRYKEQHRSFLLSFLVSAIIRTSVTCINLRLK